MNRLFLIRGDRGIFGLPSSSIALGAKLILGAAGWRYDLLWSWRTRIRVQDPRISTSSSEEMSAPSKLEFWGQTFG